MTEKREPPHLRSQEMFDWLTDDDAMMLEEYGLTWRRRLVSQVVSKTGVWVKMLAQRLDDELGTAIFNFAQNEVAELDGYGPIAYHLAYKGLFDTDWDEVAEAVLDKDGFYSGEEEREALTSEEVEAYLDRTMREED